eukprot:3693298-Pleurochrysis_carterae.AAC.3
MLLNSATRRSRQQPGLQGARAAVRCSNKLRARGVAVAVQRTQELITPLSSDDTHVRDIRDDEMIQVRRVPSRLLLVHMRSQSPEEHRIPQNFPVLPRKCAAGRAVAQVTLRGRQRRLPFLRRR